MMHGFTHSVTANLAYSHKDMYQSVVQDLCADCLIISTYLFLAMSPSTNKYAGVEGFATSPGGPVNKLIFNDGKMVHNSQADYSSQFPAGSLICKNGETLFGVTSVTMYRSGPKRGIQGFEFGCVRKWTFSTLSPLQIHCFVYLDKIEVGTPIAKYA